MEPGNPAVARCFSGTASAWMLGQAILGAGDFAMPSAQIRTAAHVRSDELDLYKVTICLDGDFRCDADGRKINLSGDRVLVSDLARPEKVELSGRWLEFYAPRSRVDAALPKTLDLHGVVLEGWAGSLIASHLRTIANEIDRIDPSSSGHVVDSMVSLIAAGISTVGGQQQSPKPPTQSILYLKILEFIEGNLQDEGLSVEKLCSTFRISRATLYRMFEPTGGVAQFIRGRRLERIHQLLTNQTSRVHLTRLSQDFGFRSSSNFSRSFREHFGYSPTSLPVSRDGNGPVHRPAVGGFAGWLDGLRSLKN